MTRKTKLEKLREAVEDANAKVNESFAEHDKLTTTKDPKTMDSIESSDYTLDLVKIVVRMADNMSKALSAYSKYTAALELKMGLFPKDDPKRKKKPL
ncbi:hypothetical protein [Nitrosopumilus adriaticus]|uniref:Uncharacterized protein n=1 Tax=Nitrosopumilus adriaticus TaxID=1580092 RepID=A0A0D5C2X5_9ARCH|nr:hypothetical protein [Nitrosopumilus adriaticus]AJW71066.1 hypothetical protein NADRNF5_1380 [Nitrosopumilus adriaticus]